MDSIDRLKLAIYESGLSEDDQEALLDYVEEASTINVPGELLQDIGSVGGVYGGIKAGAGLLDFTDLKVKKMRLNKEIKEANKRLKGSISPAEAINLRGKIAKNKSQIALIDMEIGNAKDKMTSGTIIAGAGAGLRKGGQLISARKNEKE